jgi:glycosyltransferase involved in cell wall biosynthesis
MKIALLHYSFWPEIGGVEQVMRDQANLLARAGHEVRVLSGIACDPVEGYAVEIIPELAPDFPLQGQVNAVLERGQADQNFTRYRSILVTALEAALEGVDVTLVHNAFTLHTNLALTRALHDIAPTRRFVAWTHDLAAGNPDYALPNPTQPPWNLMRTSCPGVVYVAVSERRAADLMAQLKPEIAPQIIPNPIDPVRLFGLTPEMRGLLPMLKLHERDFVFLLPAQAQPRKKIDVAIETVKQIRALGRNPLLLITGAAIPRNAASAAYGAFLRQSLPPELAGHVLFVSDTLPVRDEVLRDLYLLADCLLYPSASDGFGLPLAEAASFRLPIWCCDVPAFQALIEEGGAYLLEDPSRLTEAIAWLENQPTFRQQRRVRRLFDPGTLYLHHYEPLWNSLG